MEVASLQQARASYELSKYLQLLGGDEVLSSTGYEALKDSLNDRVEVTIMRLAVQGAFLVFNDANHLHFITGGHRADAEDNLSRVVFDSEDSAWLQIKEVDRPTWISLFQEIIAIDAYESCSASERAFNIPPLQRNPRTSKLSAISEPAQLSFFAGVPLISKNGHNIGAICVVNRTERPSLSASETVFLVDTAQKCMDLFDLAREHDFHNNWIAVQEELDRFLESHSSHAQLLDEPQMPAGRKSPMHKRISDRNDEHRDEGVYLNRSVKDPSSGVDEPPFKGEEFKRFTDASVEPVGNVAGRDNAEKARPITAKRGKDDERGLPKDDRTLRNVFQRAAEFLRSALKADGVLFVEGLVGFHNDVQLAAEHDPEPEREIVRPLHEDRSEHKELQPIDDWINISEDASSPIDSDPPGTHSITYTSTAYLNGVHVERPAGVLGVSTSNEVLKSVRVSKSTTGLPNIDVSFLHRLTTRHTKGVVWHSSNSGFMQVKDDTLIEIDLPEEAEALAGIFRDVTQLIFKPLTDPISLKRVGACFVWKTESTPLFTEAVDLRSLRAFLHVVESEIARYDALSLAKQKQIFVSSVSHELRTPLHGVLGAVQLLNESGLDPMQTSLAKMITTCGSTLHETLISVLNYAKINNFESRQHENHQWGPSRSVRTLSKRQDPALWSEGNYDRMHICTNLAMLCEEIIGVLEAGKSFHNPHSGNVTVVCNIEHQNNWSYYTEPGALRQIAVNLVGNALKYTDSGSVIFTLGAAELMEDTQRISNNPAPMRTINFTIEDTGRGMSRDFMDRQLFLPFTQEDSISSRGVGLGMSIVKNLVSLLGGEIQVQSEQNKGTKINVRVPMKLCSCDETEKGQASLDFEREKKMLRNRKLAAIIYGFPQYVRDSLANYLRDWYGCTLLEPTNDAEPDVILVDEGNEEIAEAVKNTAHAYGKQGVLLSIVMVPSRLGKRMDMIDGYIKWERVPRPLGPRNVAQGLLSCLEKLDELRKYGEKASVDTQETEEKSKNENNEPECARDNLQGMQFMSKLEKSQICETSQSPVESSWSSKSLPERSKPSANGEPITEVQAPNKSEGQKVDHELKSPGGLRILVVDDNPLNLRLLKAFFKKKGYRDTKEAIHGRAALQAAQKCIEGFDIIFMDLSMPIMNGFEATRQIRKMEAGHERAVTAKESVIIALTGLASQEDEEEAFTAGVDLFLTKPVQFPKLSNLLRQYEEGALKRQSRLEKSG